MGNWARIHPRSGKTSNEVTKRGILTKGKFRQIWWVCQKFIKGLAKYSNEMTKRGMLTVGDFQDNDKFCEDGEFGKNSKLSKVWQKSTKRWQKGASWQMAIVTNMANWATIHLRFVKIQMRWQTRHFDNCEFYENDKFGKNLKSTNFFEINKFLEKSIKDLAKFRWDDKNGHLVQIMIIRKWQIWAIKANFVKNGEYAKIHQGFGQIFKWKWQKVACWQLAILTRMTNLAKIATLARGNEWLAKWHGEKWSVGN